MIQFDRELSLVGARDSKGEFGFYSLVQNDHFQGQLHLTHAPAADCSERLQSQAEDIFKKMAEKLNYVGVLAIEFFQVKDQLLVNEIAPRVHNSGHWTQQGADTCQFENHLRAVIGLPLGSTRHNGFTAMVNISGVSSFKRDLLGINGCHLHWYGKTAHEKRKMGHLNLHANSSQEITQAINQLKHYLPLEYFPLL
jgi:5-(carboxyamino)imidazole ribonucleotide synthase